jgi:hypothetical protein
MRNLLLIAALALAACFAGCQTWNPGGTPATAKNGAFTITPPSGWMYATSLGPDLLSSREGLALQSITIQHHDLTKPLPHSKHTLTATLAPYEAAEAVLDDLRADHALLGFELQENTPATVGGQPGFKLVFRYRTSDKLHLAETCYGTIHGGSLYLARYLAPARHYFTRDLAEFEASIRTLQFKKG